MNKQAKMEKGIRTRYRVTLHFNIKEHSFRPEDLVEIIQIDDFGNRFKVRNLRYASYDNKFAVITRDEFTRIRQCITPDGVKQPDRREATAKEMAV